jgi:hypothetical protein
MIVRTVKRSNYFSLNKTAVDDERLSYKALGIHTYLMSKPDQWEANEADIVNRHTEGQSAVRSGIQELIQYGYMARIQLRQDNKIVGWRLDTFEMPQLNPYYSPETAGNHVVLEQDCENLNQGGSEGGQDCEKLDVGFLDVGNHNHSNNRISVSNEEQLLDAGASRAMPVPPPPLAKQFQNLLEQLQAKGCNRPAVLKQVYLLCFGEREDEPDFGYLGKVAKEMGAGLLARRMFELVANPPAGDVLAYIAKVHKGGGNGYSTGGRKHADDGRRPVPEDDPAEVERVRQQWQAHQAAIAARSTLSLPGVQGSGVRLSG